MAIQISEKDVTSSNIDNRSQQAIHPHQLYGLQIRRRLCDLVLRKCVGQPKQILFPASLCALRQFPGLFFIIRKDIFKQFQHVQGCRQKLNLALRQTIFLKPLFNLFFKPRQTDLHQFVKVQITSRHPKNRAGRHRNFFPRVGQKRLL